MESPPPEPGLRESPTTVRGIALAVLQAKPTQRIYWTHSDNRIMAAHAARHRLTLNNCATTEMSELLDRLGLRRGDAVEDAVRPRVVSAMRYLLQRLEQQGVLRVSVDLETGGRITQWPAWTADWTNPEWDGSERPPEGWTWARGHGHEQRDQHEQSETIMASLSTQPAGPQPHTCSSRSARPNIRSPFTRPAAPTPLAGLSRRQQASSRPVSQSLAQTRHASRLPSLLTGSSSGFRPHGWLDSSHEHGQTSTPQPPATHSQCRHGGFGLRSHVQLLSQRTRMMSGGRHADRSLDPTIFPDDSASHAGQPFSDRSRPTATTPTAKMQQDTIVSDHDPSTIANSFPAVPTSRVGLPSLLSLCDGDADTTHNSGNRMDNYRELRKTMHQLRDVALEEADTLLAVHSLAAERHILGERLSHLECEGNDSSFETTVMMLRAHEAVRAASPRIDNLAERARSLHARIVELAVDLGIDPQILGFDRRNYYMGLPTACLFQLLDQNPSRETCAGSDQT
ncbi:hypothetical protein QBC47DRAFT_418782 [Echria macrotheca]|uniref:Uncharacterized protein n=1 Tax=Echria macrotheca TaxID=438768 RepID=A0AAJ0B1S7_9PEZI|nr:hypothetical protein QBC47DRAFT_418782 [Echria macrotheca]